MTHTIAYDSFEDSELLKKAGYNEDQIKIEIFRTKKQNEEFNKIIDNNLATKHDIALVQHDIAELRKDNKHEFELVRHDIAELRKDNKHDIDGLRKDTKHEFELVRHDITELRKDMGNGFALIHTKFDSKFESLTSKTNMLLWFIGITGLGTLATQLLKMLGFQL